MSDVQRSSEAAVVAGGPTAPPTFAETVIKPLLGLAVRHVAGAIAGGLMAHGWVSSSAGEQVSGAIVLGGVAFWSWWNKRGRAMLLQDVANLRAILQARADAARRSGNATVVSPGAGGGGGGATQAKRP